MKVVTYRQLLQDADAFGQGESLSGAVGTLSLTLQPGDLVLVPAACKEVTLQGHCLVKSIKCVSEK